MYKSLNAKRIESMIQAGGNTLFQKLKNWLKVFLSFAVLSDFG